MIAPHAVDRNFYCHRVLRATKLSETCNKKRRNVNSSCRSSLLQAQFNSLNQCAGLFVVLGLQDLATTVVTVRADVMAHMRFTCGWFDAQLWGNQEIMRTMHAALGWGLLVLLNSHDNS
jgi:hypothetical protein